MEPSKAEVTVGRSSPFDGPADEAELEPAALSRALKGRHMQMIAIGRFLVHFTLFSY